MQVIAVDDDGGDILEKGKEEQIQIFAVDDDDGGSVSSKLIYTAVFHSDAILKLL